MHDSKVGIMYFIFMNASGPPLFSSNSSVSCDNFFRKFQKLLKYHLNKIPNIFTESLVIVNSIPNIHYNKSQ